MNHNTLIAIGIALLIIAALRALSGWWDRHNERKLREQLLQRYGQCTYPGCGDVQLLGTRCTKHREPLFTLDFSTQEMETKAGSIKADTNPPASEPEGRQPFPTLIRRPSSFYCLLPEDTEEPIDRTIGEVQD